MKIRQGFVSNSSSSSFIAVFAKINDSANVSRLGDYIKTGKELIEMNYNDYAYLCCGDWAGVEVMPEKEDLDPEAKYIIFESWGGAGDDDSDFWEGGDDGYMNYNVELTDFDIGEQEVYNSVTEENGFTEVNKGFGAGRNG